MSKEAKEFQRATADRIEEIFRSGRQKRVLLADEVGLGKTIIAKEVIDRVRRMRQEKRDDMFRVVYVCSNISIVHQNTRNLGISRQLNISESRLSMQHLIIQEQVAELKKNGLYREDGDYEEGAMPELLIPLTPGTSFAMTNGCGNVNERALMFCVCREARLVDDGAQALFCRGVKHWTEYVGNYTKRIRDCGEEYVSKMRTRLAGENAVRELQDCLQGDKSKDEYGILVDLRRTFAQLSIEELEPDFVIMDEFQRFSSLISDSQEKGSLINGLQAKDLQTDGNHAKAESEQSMIARAFFRTMDDENAPLILLISATPYKPYSTLEELNEENADAHYEDFLKLTNFLFAGERAERFRTVWKDYSVCLSHLSRETFDVLIASKNRAESLMYSAMCRTERLSNSLIDMKQHVDDCVVDKGDILSYAHMQKILRHCEERAVQKGMKQEWKNVPMEYVKSSPYLLSFMDKYTLKQYIVNACRKSGSIPLPINNWTQQVLLNWEKIYRYQKLSANNARFRRLQKIMLDDEADSACLLWVPASHPYYKVAEDSVFDCNRRFSKMLVFSAWEMVPRMISFMLSYEAERQTIGSYRGGKKSPTYTNKVGDKSLDSCREALEFSCPYLTQLYNPEEHFCRSLSEIEETLCKKIEKDIESRGGKIGSGVGETEIETLLNCLRLLDGQSEEPEVFCQSIIQAIARMAIASPAVVLHRCLGNAGANCAQDKMDANHALNKTDANHDLIEEKIDGLAREFVSTVFGSRVSTGIMERLYPDTESYFEKVLRYCAEGNLQAVIDEYFHLIDDSGTNAQEFVRTMQEALVIGSTLEIDTTENFRDTSVKRRRFRVHYAMPFANNKSDEKNVSHSINMRLAFNSPFRPFVLTTTSIGQEGLDFHLYCRKIMHWNIPSNPQDMEQREGRINRYKCLAIRRNIARKYARTFDWNAMFDQAYEELKGEYGGLVPFWSIPLEEFQDVEPIERIVPFYPLSTDRSRYSRLNAVLSLYRLTMGQPRQEELVELIQNNLTNEQAEKLMFNLSPIKHKMKE